MVIFKNLFKNLIMNIFQKLAGQQPVVSTKLSLKKLLD
jgi:hypothetical protein